MVKVRFSFRHENQCNTLQSNIEIGWRIGELSQSQPQSLQCAFISAPFCAGKRFLQHAIVAPYVTLSFSPMQREHVREQRRMQQRTGAAILRVQMRQSVRRPEMRDRCDSSLPLKTVRVKVCSRHKFSSFSPSSRLGQDRFGPHSVSFVLKRRSNPVRDVSAAWLFLDKEPCVGIE